MPFTYSQTKGIMRRQSGTEFQGYSGFRNGLNNPALQAITNTGPIPQGIYTISAPFTHPTKGPAVMRLTPDPENVMYGRSGFLIHGAHADDKQNSSEGCIILPREARNLIGKIVGTGDDKLTVVKDFSEEA